MTRKEMYEVFGDIVMTTAETAAWAGDQYSHPDHGVCAAVFYPVHNNEIICLYRDADTIPVAYGLLNEPRY